VSIVCSRVEVSCDELITRTEESYRLLHVAVCDLETSRMRRPWPALGCSATGEKYILRNVRFQERLLNECGGGGWSPDLQYREGHLNLD